MRSGKVKWFDCKKGFGFIVDDETGMDIFVHYTGIRSEGYKSLDDGQNVIFSIVNTDRGKQAVSVVAV